MPSASLGRQARGDAVAGGGAHVTLGGSSTSLEMTGRRRGSDRVSQCVRRGAGIPPTLAANRASGRAPGSAPAGTQMSRLCRRWRTQGRWATGSCTGSWAWPPPGSRPRSRGARSWGRCGSRASRCRPGARRCRPPGRRRCIGRRSRCIHRPCSRWCRTCRVGEVGGGKGRGGRVGTWGRKRGAGGTCGMM